LYRRIESKEICLSDDSILKDKNNIRRFIESTRIYNHWIARRFIAHSVCIHSKSINRIYNKESSWIASRLIAFTNIFFVEQTFVFLHKITELHSSFSSNQFSSSSLWYLRTYLIKIKLSLISCNKHVHKLFLLSSTHNTLLHSLLSMNQMLKSSYLMI